MTRAALAIPLRLARRELRAGAKGFWLFLACLALGVTAITAVGSLTAAIIAGVNEDAQVLLGGDAAIRQAHRDISKDQADWLAARGAVSRVVDLRGMARTEDGAARTVVELKAIDAGYPLFGALSLSPALPDGVRPAAFLGRQDGVWGAAVDPALLTKLGIGLGARLRVGKAIYEVRATVKREPDRTAGGRGFLFGPRFFVAEDSLAATGLIRIGSLIYYNYRVALPPGTDASAWRAALDTAFPDASWRVRDRANVSPRITRVVNRTSIFLALVGLTTLLVGGLGVSNAVRAYLATKTRAIATLKCLGARSGQIFAAYLIQVLVMAALAISIGVIVGATLPFVVADLLKEALPVPIKFGIYGPPLLLAGAFGFLVTLVFSLWPIARACEVPPARLFRDAVAPAGARPKLVYLLATGALALALAGLTIWSATDRRLAIYFVIGAVVAMAAFWCAGQVARWLARQAGGVRHAGLRLALANLHRPGAPTLSLVMSLGLGLTVLIGVALVQGNLAQLVSESLPERAPGHFFIDIQPHQVEPFEGIVRSHRGLQRMERTPMLRGRITKVNGVPAAEMQVNEGGAWVLRGDRGITWSARPPSGGRTAAGTWWRPDYRGKPLVSFDAGAARNLGVGVGDTLTVNVLGREITAEIANLRWINWRSLGINFMLVFSPGVLDGAPVAHIAAIRAPAAVGDAIERAVAEEFPNITAIRTRDAFATLAGIIERIGAAIQLAAGVTLLAGTLVLAGAVAAGHRMRVYDSVVLKVLGATRRNVVTAYLLEYGILGLGTALIAALLGTIGARIVVLEIMRIHWTFLPQTVLWTALAAGIVTIAAGFIGTWRALGQKPAPLLRNE